MIKKLIHPLVLFTICSLSANAQSTLQEFAKDANVFYLDRFELPTSIKDSVVFVRVIKQDTTDKEFYTVQDFYLNGVRRLLGRSTLPLPGLRREGVFIEYYRNGKRKSVKNYEKNAVKGDQIYYYPNGKPYYTGKYDADSKQMIISGASDSTGTQIAKDGNGTFIIYDDDFKLIKGTGPLVNGLKEGEWKGNVSDTATYVCLYKAGLSVSGTSTTKSGARYQFTKDHDYPEFVGGEMAFYRFLARTMHYPVVAKENNVQGKVFITFTVGKDGVLRDFWIVKGIGSGCDEEVVRTLKLSPRWKPGLEYGILTPTYYTIPISFTLQTDR